MARGLILPSVVNHPESELRPFQRQALDALRSGASVVCVAPTGRGKSRIFEQFALESRRPFALISPLVALARQQRNTFKALGLERALVCSPEQRESSRGQRLWASVRPDWVVVDECHCVWEWGQGFRKAFRRVVDPILDSPEIKQTLWLTATLPPFARLELRQWLHDRGRPVVEIGAFDLPEGLRVAAAYVPWRDRLDALAGWMQTHPEPGLIFAWTREGTERLTRYLQASGRRVAAYHAGLSREERCVVELQLARGELDCVVATSAFGMGVHFPDLKWALLWQAPSSPLALAQAVGRVGRGGTGEAWVFWEKEDFSLWERMGAPEADLEMSRRALSHPRGLVAGLQTYFNGG